MGGTEPQGRELILVGTVHRDPEGFKKLAVVLARERPGAVAVELSPYGLFFRCREGRRLRRRLERRLRRSAKARGGAWQSWGQLHAIDLQLALPFEYRAALRYCRDTGAPLSLIDLSSWSREAIQTKWPQMVSLENLSLISAEPPEALCVVVRRDYEMAARLLHEPAQSLVPAFLRSCTEDPAWEEREAVLAAKVAEVFGEMQMGRLVYVGGWQHLVGSRGCGTLYERLEHLTPRRVLLADFAERR
ncbi:MAG: hypothetical protein H6Q51_255 [Deltaproteobacteria bacterium]|jgi:hypothetical protein|nr:hypothetical protein [Deltaproteobacteria bacterium]